MKPFSKTKCIRGTIKSFTLPTRRNVRSDHLSEPVTLQRILVPIDFSDCSRGALRYALSLARQAKAELILLYVAEVAVPGSEFGPVHLPKLESDLRQIGKKELAKLIKQEIHDEVRTKALVQSGRSDLEIVAAANNLKVDLIVMATHGYDRRLDQLGSTAEQVVRRAPCPVLLVPVQECCLPFFL